MILVIAKDFGRRCYGGIRYGIFHIVCYRFKHLVTRNIAVFHPKVLTSVRSESRILHGFKRKVMVKTAKTLDHSIRDRDYPRITDHAVSLATPQMPYRKFALLLIYFQHCVYHVRHPVLMYDGHKGHCCTVSVPEGKCSIVSEIFCFMYLMIGSVIASVHITEKRRGYHGMIQCSIEYSPRGFILSPDPYFRKFVVPRPVRNIRHSIEIPARKFCRQILPRPFYADRRQSHFQKNRFVFFRAERSPSVHIIPSMHGKTVERLGKFCDEIHSLVSGPAFRPAASLDAVVSDRCHLRLYRLVPAAAVLQIENYGCIIGLRECVSVESDPCRSRKLRSDVITEKRDTVISRTADFLRPVRV